MRSRRRCFFCLAHRRHHAHLDVALDEMSLERPYRDWSLIRGLVGALETSPQREVTRRRRREPQSDVKVLVLLFGLKLGHGGLQVARSCFLRGPHLALGASWGRDRLLGSRGLRIVAKALTTQQEPRSCVAYAVPAHLECRCHLLQLERTAACEDLEW
jgi:hypothetical protein